MGAQGMNTGLQDAYNLAWKLALVIKGRADAALLDSYEQERMPVAQRLLRTTDRAFQLVVSDGWLAGMFRTRIMARLAARAMTVERVRRLAFRTISQIGIRYPDSRCRRIWKGWRRARQGQATDSRGCNSGCDQVLRLKICSMRSTTATSICLCSEPRNTRPMWQRTPTWSVFT